MIRPSRVATPPWKEKFPELGRGRPISLIVPHCGSNSSTLLEPHGMPYTLPLFESTAAQKGAGEGRAKAVKPQDDGAVNTILILVLICVQEL